MIGLVLAGGQSSRMRMDKALLVYNQLPQWQVVQDLLLPYCSRIFINSNLNLPTNHAVITDSFNYKNIGPLAGILSLFEIVQEPILVIAIDYPFLTAGDISALYNAYLNGKETIVMYNSKTNFYHPQIGIYTVEFLRQLKQEIVPNQMYSLQNKLQELNITKLQLSDNLRLESVDTYTAYLSLKK
jgi:molybdenum cofactor guanylyltransferase